jgi:TolB protein
VDATVQPGGNLTFRLKATDPNSDALYAAWTATGGALTVSGERQMEWSDADQAWVSQVDWTAPASGGPFTITCSVSDNQGGTARISKVAAIATSARIAFSSNRDGNYEIYVMNDDGTGVTRLTSDPNSDWCPVWSPDGTRIAFMSNRDDSRGEIYVMNADGTGVTRLTNNSTWDYYPSWRPDGTRIAYRQGGGTMGVIQVMNADGSGIVNLTPGFYDCTTPSWSGDGNRIIFSRFSLSPGPPLRPHSDLYEINADGTGGTNMLTNAVGDDEHYLHPRWSPDGNRIAYVYSVRNPVSGVNEYDIRSMDSSFTSETRLYGESSNSFDGGPSWSPDSARIAFTGYRGGSNYEIYVMNGDGTGVTNLTNNSASDSYPSWSR